MTDVQLLEVACSACRDRHTIGLPAGHPGPLQAWCPRSARPYTVTIEEAIAPTST